MRMKTAEESEAEILTELARRTFIQTFAKDNLKENMDLYVAATFHPELQLREIQDPKRIIEVLWMGEEPVGFLHLMKSQPDTSIVGESPIELLKLYLDSSWQGRGLGAALMDRCLEIARDGGYRTLWLGVWERNFRAQEFYTRYGFKIVGQQIFKLGNEDQTDMIMSRGI